MEVVILGGGMCSLSAAYKFCKDKIPCTIIEKAPEVGGIAGTYKIDSFRIEKYYHHLFKTDTTFLEMAAELGIEEKIKWHESSTSFFYKGKFYKFSGALDLLRFKPLKFFDRLRFGLNVLNLGKDKDLDSMSAEEWLINKWGESIYSTLFKPMLKTKFGMGMDKASAAFVHGRLKARAESRKGGKEMLGYMEGSFQIFIDKLESYLKENGCTILKNQEITSLEKTKGSFMISTKDKQIQADIILNTLPLSVFRQITKFKVEKVRDIKYQGVVCAVLGLKKPVSRYYWTNILEDLPFGAMIEHTNFVDKKDYTDNHVIYLANYCDRDSNLFKMDDNNIVSSFMKALNTVNPDIKEEDLVWAKVSKDADATPVFEKGYAEKIPATKTSVPNLYLAGSFQIYPGSRNMNSIADAGFKAADIIIQDEKSD